ncbi:disabled homolog 2-like isoform X2 [Sander lucioperca]|uniref:disabled homolog 2-like isoform X2 n=1 Tax=Sander lucioperca TaxID=283035 RepID=UPI00125E2459|nr:disabled homolog 2-like isoform X2 [Sander lucioperca]XP_035862749.1 disabled homolog 2-like isoform X2 [Sander lucioperca]
MMETEQTAASCHAPGQTSVRTWLSSSIRAPRTPSDTTSRFHGDGVRYKAKLIGVDPVPDAQGEKMCWDSMMKLKGFEAAARKQGKHKQRVWLKVSSSGLRIVDERTGAVLYDHDRSRISSLTKDKSDPRALAYVSQHQDTYCLFYIKMANLVTAHSTTCHADPVLVDIEEVCQNVDQETPQEAAEAPTQNNSLLLLSESSAPPAEEPAFEDVFSPRPDSSSGHSNQASFSNELMEVFSIQKEEPLMANQSTSQPEPPQPTLNASEILSLFPTQPVGGSPYCSPPYSPTSTWGQQGLLGNQWAGPAAAPWPTMPSSMASWAPTGMAAPHTGGQNLAQGPQPGVMGGGNTLASPTAVSGYSTPLNSFYAPAGATGPLQSVSASLDQNPYL